MEGVADICRLFRKLLSVCSARKWKYEEETSLDRHQLLAVTRSTVR